MIALLAPSACSKTYYSMWETLGKDKRDLLVDRVEDVRDGQKETKEQFEDALTRMRKLYGTGGGKLEETYDALKADYDASESRADALANRIDSVEKVADDLFAEWSQEIDGMENARLKADSRAKLVQTKRRFEGMRTAMNQAERSMKPVLTQFRDQVTYLKHNLNAQAVGNLGGEARDIEKSMGTLIREMNRSIAASDAFLKTLATDVTVSAAH